MGKEPKAKPPSGVSPTDLDFTKKIQDIFNEVVKASKEKKLTDKDRPKIRKRPRSFAKEKKKARKKARGESIHEGATITLKEIAFDFEMEAKEVRRILRKARIEKPGGRWEWPVDHDDIERIKKLVGARKKR